MNNSTNNIGGGGGRVRVIVRVRPALSTERNIKQAVDVLNAQRLRATKGHCTLDLSFDHVLTPQDSQQDVYDQARGSIDGVLNGYNTTIFAYGQTGTGKTHTMLGGGGSNEEVDAFLSGGSEKWAQSAGIIPRTIDHIFAHIDNVKHDFQYSLSCSYLEIYNEKVYDLLQLNQRVYGVGLDIHEDRTRGVFVSGITEVMVHSAQDVFILMRQGARNRSIDSTEMNDHSSRSHTIFQLFVERKSLHDSDSYPPFRAKLNLVDLAGSEKWKTTYMSSTMGPQRIQEMMSINQSLSTLGNCIAAVLQSGRTHIPFRDSKLTRLLQDSLGGNTKTTFIATISPSVLAFKETCSTLKFADRVKRVAVGAKVNEVLDDRALIKRYEREIARLQELVKMNGNREYIAQMEELDVENLYLKEQIRKLESTIAQEREARAYITNVLKETLEKLKNRQNPENFVADNLYQFEEMVARTPPPAPLQHPAARHPTTTPVHSSHPQLHSPQHQQQQQYQSSPQDLSLAQESIIYELNLMEDQMMRVTGECVETFRTNLADALPVLMKMHPISSDRSKFDTEQIINGCSKALQDAVWRVQHQAMQRAELLCSHSFNTAAAGGGGGGIGMDQDVVDRLSDIYACADQLKSFGKYIHHHKKDQAAFDPRYVFEDIVHHLTDSIFDLQNVASSSYQPAPPPPQKNVASRSSTPTKNQISLTSTSTSISTSNGSPSVSRRSTPSSSSSSSSSSTSPIDFLRTPPQRHIPTNFNSPTTTTTTTTTPGNRRPP